MKKVSLVLGFVLSVALTTTSFSEKKYALLKPAQNGKKSEAIPISKNQIKQIQKFRTAVKEKLKFINTTGFVDTLQHNNTLSVIWSIIAGDTNSVYYDPPAACIIKAIGIVGINSGNRPLAESYNLMIHKPAVPWTWDTDSAESNKWYTRDKYGYQTLLGDLLWGDVSVKVINGERVWTEMLSHNFEPEIQGDPFVVSIVPVGEDGSYLGTYADEWNEGDPEAMKLAKFYQAGNGGHPPQFVVRKFICDWMVVVEFLDNAPPVITAESYGTVVSSEAKTLSCTVTDIDATDATRAGVASVSLFYKVDDGAEMKVVCTLTSGTDTDGVWDGVVPAGYMSPGQTLSYYFVATDKAGLSSTSNSNSFGYFKKNNDILVFYNDNGDASPSRIISQLYDNLWIDTDGDQYTYDVWVGLTDGGLTSQLVNMYNNIVQIDASSPNTINDNVLSKWFASGPKKMFWSSQDWGYVLTGGTNLTFAEDDWHNKYMGIGTIGPMDINFPHTKAEFPINAVAEDIISGVLADFVADSLQLYYDPQYELGFESFCDALTPGNGAVPCFVDSAKGRVMGVHKESSNGTRCVFLGFDQLSLNTQALAGYTITAGYHRVENNVFSVVGAALRWFGLDQADVKDNLAPVISTTYVLHQNHPNPFNPQTIITYNLAEACFVRLVVYNVLGQKVAVLVNEYKSANSYKVNFNANNLTSGVYFYRLNAGDYSVTKKMMLLP